MRTCGIRPPVLTPALGNLTAECRRTWDETFFSCRASFSCRARQDSAPVFCQAVGTEATGPSRKRPRNCRGGVVEAGMKLRFRTTESIHVVSDCDCD
jgi:hypothetical protein